MSVPAEPNLSVTARSARATLASFVVALTVGVLAMIQVGSASAGGKLIDKASPNIYQTCTTPTPVNAPVNK